MGIFTAKEAKKASQSQVWTLAGIAVSGEVARAISSGMLVVSAWK
jgi:hypothetical protein